MIRKLVFNSNDTITNCLKIFDEVLNNLSPNKKKMLELANLGYMTATDLADYLLKNTQCHLERHIKKQLLL